MYSWLPHSPALDGPALDGPGAELAHGVEAWGAAARGATRVNTAFPMRLPRLLSVEL